MVTAGLIATTLMTALKKSFETSARRLTALGNYIFIKKEFLTSMMMKENLEM